MQTWEYKVIEIYNEVRMAMVNWLWEEDGKKLSGKPDMLAKAKELGSEGWELTSTHVTGTPFRYTYWFKRPK